MNEPLRELKKNVIEEGYCLIPLNLGYMLIKIATLL
jgi:hypothetical protein